MNDCYCGLDQSYEDCCGRFHQGQSAETAEALVRSRYSAYVVGDLAYVRRTAAGKALQEAVNLEAANEQSTIAWKQLEIIRCEEGGKHDNEGVVIFSAYFQNPDKPIEVMHEKSLFKKINGAWFYVDGAHFELSKNHSKIGRNDICSCGSGRKHKKCCGA